MNLLKQTLPNIEERPDRYSESLRIRNQNGLRAINNRVPRRRKSTPTDPTSKRRVTPAGKSNKKPKRNQSQANSDGNESDVPTLPDLGLQGNSFMSDDEDENKNKNIIHFVPQSFRDDSQDYPTRQ